MESWLRSECSCKSTPSPLTSSSCKPQNRYLCYLLDEFEKCSQQSGDLTKLQKVVTICLISIHISTGYKLIVNGTDELNPYISEICHLSKVFAPNRKFKGIIRD